MEDVETSNGPRSTTAKLHVGLNLQVGEFATNKSLRVEDSVPQVRCGPVLCGVSDETLILGGCDIGGCCAGVA